MQRNNCSVANLDDSALELQEPEGDVDHFGQLCTGQLQPVVCALIPHYPGVKILPFLSMNLLKKQNAKFPTVLRFSVVGVNAVLSAFLIVPRRKSYHLPVRTFGLKATKRNNESAEYKAQ